MLIGAATNETCDVSVEPNAVVPLGAVVVATTGVKDLNGELQAPGLPEPLIIRYGALYKFEAFLTFIQG